MELKLKPISKAGITEAISKAELYRYLNEPGEAESICRDILAQEPLHQTALRLLGLAITDAEWPQAIFVYQVARPERPNLEASRQVCSIFSRHKPDILIDP